MQVGERQPSPRSLEVTEAECLAFSQAYDPQPMHTDPAVAAKSRFRGIIASGWHTAAMAMRLLAEMQIMGATEVLGMGVENLRWHLPVRPGDILSIEVEVVSVKPSDTNPRYGVVKFLITTRNQRGETVMTHSPSCWVPKRP
jgi:acyl dehydratase